MGTTINWKEQYLSEILKILSTFGTMTAARGADYFRQRRVSIIGIKKDNDGLHCEADVEGGRKYEVDFSIYKDGKLDAFCSCPVTDGPCKHLYASLRACYTAIENNMASGRSKPTEEVAAVTKWADSLSEYLTKVSGGKMSPRLKKRIPAIVECYEDFIEGRDLDIGDLAQMGMRAPGYAWEVADFWPEDKAESDCGIVAFFLILIAYTRYSGGALDRELELPYDFALVEEYVERLKKQLNEEQYREFFTRLTYNIPSKNLLNLKTTADLYLRLNKGSADLEGIFSVSPQYKVLKDEDADYLWEGLMHNQITMDEGSLFLLENFNAIDHYSSVSLDLQIPRHAQILRNILLHPAARDKVIGKTGAKFEWVEEPLEWVVEKADNEPEAGVPEGHYSVHLAWPSGRPVPEWSKFIPGQPTLYLSQDAIAAGPNPALDVFQINNRTILPGEWIERKQTLKALSQFGVKMPEELIPQSQHQLKEIRPVLHFRARIDGDMESEEVCRIEVKAVTPDHGTVLLEYGLHGWKLSEDFDPGVIGAESIEEAVNLEEWIDDSSIGLMPSLMRHVHPYYNGGMGCFELVLNRHFPDLFHLWLSGLPNDAVVELDPILNELQGGEIDGKMWLDVSEDPSNTDWFDIDLVLDTGDVELTAEEKALLLKSAGKWVRLKNGSWKKLNFTVSEEDNNELAMLGLSPLEIQGGKQKAHAIQLANNTAGKWMDQERFDQIKNMARNVDVDVQPDIPDNVSATLRPYQKDGFHFLSYLSENNFGGILADDMGLGKTLQTLTWLSYLHREQGIPNGPVLVVCPKSVMDNWANEVEQFISDTPVYVWDASEIRNFAVDANKFEIHVINYAQMRNRVEQMTQIHWMAVILDEAQNIKNPSSKGWRAATDLNARYRLALTGTPIENRLMDLWSIMEFTMPGVLGNRTNFQKHYNPKKDPLAHLRLSNRIRPFILRRTKDQVAQDLPERVEEDILCSMTGEQLSMYKAELKRAQQIMLKIQTSKELSKVKFNVLTSLLRLRQICCHPQLYNRDSKGKSAKLDALGEHVSSILEQGSKVLVFSQFVGMLDILKITGEKEGWKMWELTGKTENRGDLVKEFQNHEGPGVFFISLKAGGAGLNLTAAQYVILFDPWWNPAVENQAIDRTHRIGQTNKVVAYRFLAKDSVEQKIRHLQKEKSQLASDVLDESKFSESLSMEDFQYIFADPE